MKDRRFAGRREGAAVLVLVLLAVAGLLFLGTGRGAGAVAEVVLDGDVIARLPLGTDQEYAVPANPQVRLQVRDGRCGFVHSDCPDQICVHAGFLGDGGQTAACLPNRVLMRIVEEDTGGANRPDTVAG